MRSAPWTLLGLASAVAAGCGDASLDDGSGGTSAGGGPAFTATSTSGDGGGATGGGGATYVPDPIPVLDEEPPPLCASPGPGFQFLDDSCGAKVQPTHVDRDLACPIVDLSPTVELAGGGFVTYEPSSSPVVVDDTALLGVVPDELYVTVILIRRVDGVPHYRYLSNGWHDEPYQPWSTTKVLAAANAGARLRLASSDLVGLTAEAGGYLLGDFVTSICNYDYDPFSSNSLGRYMHDVGGRQRANDLIHGLWLDRPTTETFGGNYGQPSPSGVGYSFIEPGTGETVSVAPDATAGPANYLSSFTMAEAIKRVVLHREEPTQAMPGLAWADAKVLLYGAAASDKYGEFGGMSRDKAIYFQSGHDAAYLESRSKGHWRTFSKLGNGSSGEFLDVGYACLPVLDDALEPAPGWGRELVIAAHLPTGGASWAERDRLLARAFRSIMIRVVDGRL